MVTAEWNLFTFKYVASFLKPLKINYSVLVNRNKGFLAEPTAPLQLTSSLILLYAEKHFNDN